MSSSSDLQPQDLVVYSDGSVVSQGSSPHLNLILYTQSTKSTWLTIALVQSHLLGTCYINSTQRHSVSTSNVLFVSFTNDQQLYSKQFQKHLKPAATGFKFISLLQQDKPDKWFEIIQREASRLSSKKPLTLFVEDPQFALYLTETTCDSILSKLTQLNRLADNLYLILPQDKSLLDYSEISNDLATEYSTFLMKLVYRCHLIFSLRPLRTGRAEDITGELVVIKGLLDDPDTSAVQEKDYLYQANKEGSVKLFYR